MGGFLKILESGKMRTCFLEVCVFFLPECMSCNDVHVTHFDIPLPPDKIYKVEIVSWKPSKQKNNIYHSVKR